MTPPSLVGASKTTPWSSQRSRLDGEESKSEVSLCPVLGPISMNRPSMPPRSAEGPSRLRPGCLVGTGMGCYPVKLCLQSVVSTEEKPGTKEGSPRVLFIVPGSD